MNETETDRVADDTPPKEVKQALPKPRGAQELRLAAEIILQLKALEIAEALCESSLEGHILSTKFLYELCLERERLGEGQDPAQHRKNLIDQWAEEDEWTPEASEQIAETTAGSLEPE